MDNLEKVDIVIPWVDGSDSKWQIKKRKYESAQNVSSDREYNGSMRYRDYGTLKYLFRSIDKYAKWVNHVYLVTDNQKPAWINEDYSKMTVIDHKDFIPHEYLPTFNTNTIELNVHRIESLSEKFVLLNDDMLFTSYTAVTDFFSNGLPVDNFCLSVMPTTDSFSHILLNDMLAINRHFEKKEVLKKNWAKVFSFKNGKLLLRTFLTLPWPNLNGFYNPHLSISYTKDAYEQLWGLEFGKLNETSSHKIRSFEDLSDWAVRYFQLCSGEFEVGDPNKGKAYSLATIEELRQEFLHRSKHKIICINDVDEDSSTIRKNVSEIQKLLSEKFPEKSGFEV